MLTVSSVKFGLNELPRSNRHPAHKPVADRLSASPPQGPSAHSERTHHVPRGGVQTVPLGMVCASAGARREYDPAGSPSAGIRPARPSPAQPRCSPNHSVAALLARGN